MTDKSIEDVREWLATEVMGWRRYESVTAGGSLTYSYEVEENEARLGNNGESIYKQDWKPDQNLEQAFDVIFEYCQNNNLEYLLTSEFCELYEKESTYIRSHYQSDKSINDRIIGCILKAKNKTELLEVLEVI